MDDSRKVQSLKKRYGRTLPPPKGPMGHGPGGPGRRRNMAKGTPKNSRKTVKRLLGYLNEDKARMALAFFCVIVNTAASLGVGWICCHYIISPALRFVKILDILMKKLQPLLQTIVPPVFLCQSP